ncbi:MAG TPA: succinate dehydrogenase, hydrophobic membrane anchor protein [Burkholderiales bacterium]
MSRSRPLGSAHRGTAAFLIQRLSSLYLGAFTVYLVICLLVGPTPDYAGWTEYFSSTAVRLAWTLFIGSLLAHAWTGLRSIYLDYIHPTGLRFAVSTLTAFGLIALAVWAVQILFGGGA